MQHTLNESGPIIAERTEGQCVAVLSVLLEMKQLMMQYRDPLLSVLVKCISNLLSEHKAGASEVVTATAFDRSLSKTSVQYLPQC